MKKMTLAEKIVNRRIELRLTQRYVADLAGIDPASYSRIENGKIKKIQFKTKIKLAEALQVDIHYFDDDYCQDKKCASFDINQLPDEMYGKLAKYATANNMSMGEAVEKLLANSLD